jgi:hypothetical protein
MIRLALILALLASPAHAQGIQYEHWSDTNGWHGETVTQGDHVQTRDYGPHGERHICWSYLVGSQRITSCADN